MNMYNRPGLPIIFAIFLLRYTNGQNLIVPSTFQSCQPIAVTWGSAPSSGANYENSDIFFTNPLDQGLTLSVLFHNIPPAGMSFTSIFKPSSSLSVVTAFGQENIAVEDSGQRDCLLDIFSPPGTIGHNGSVTPPLSFDDQTYNIRQCQEATISWSGGVPPYELSVSSPFSSGSSFTMLVKNITNTLMTITFPLRTNQDSTSYTISLVDSSLDQAEEATAAVFIVDNNDSASVRTNCLMEIAESTSPASSHPSSSSHRTTIIAIVVSVAVLIILAPITMIVLRYLRRKRLVRKRESFKKYISSIHSRQAKTSDSGEREIK